jgi:hypothetical protein
MVFFWFQAVFKYWISWRIWVSYYASKPHQKFTLAHFGQLHKPPPIIALMAHVVLSSWRANAPTTITLQWSKMNYYWVMGPCGDWFVYSSLLDTVDMTDVWHNIICKKISWKNKTIYWYSSKHLKIELNWVTSYKCTI